jgi:hypothetical protein
MKPTHTRRQGESSQGWGLSGGGPVVSRRGQGTRSRGRSGPGLHPAALQGRLTGPVAGGRAWGGARPKLHSASEHPVSGHIRTRSVQPNAIRSAQGRTCVHRGALSPEHSR